jgi:hypothetical protein
MHGRQAHHRGVPPQALAHRGCGVPPQAVPAASRRGDHPARGYSKRGICRWRLNIQQPTRNLQFPRGRTPSRSHRKQLPALLLLIIILLPRSVSAQTTPPTTRVGLPITLVDLYISGGEARPKPRPDHKAPLVLRLLAVKPAADGHRYDMEVYGLESGSYNLTDFLEPVDSTKPPHFTDPVPLTVTTALPPGLPKPAELTTNPPSRIGGYRSALWILGSLWVLVLAALLFWKKRGAQASEADAPPPSLSERLHALITMASHGELDAGQQATLERLILGHWHQRLPELASLPPAQALSRLRHHDEAGPLLRQLEQWLHAKDSDIDDDQIDALLAPYRD